MSDQRKPRTPQIPGPGTTPLGLPGLVRDISGRPEFVVVDGVAHDIAHRSDCPGGRCNCQEPGQPLATIL